MNFEGNQYHSLDESINIAQSDGDEQQPEQSYYSSAFG